MEQQEAAAWPNVPEQIESLRDYVARFPHEVGVGPEFYERKEFWASFSTSLRETAEQGKISWEQFDSLMGSLIAAKEWLGDYDLLTGLGNRRSYQQHLQERLAESKRHNSSLVLVELDLDNFKALNDERGHPAGNRFLIELGKLIRGHKRAEDFAARVGGDEIMIILPHATSEGTEVFITRLKEEIQKLIEGNTEFLGLPKPLGVSFGYAEWDRQESIEELEKRVDDNLYTAKNAKKK